MAKPLVKEALALLSVCGLNPLNRSWKSTFAALLCIGLCLNIAVEVLMFVILDWSKIGSDKIQQPLIGWITTMQIIGKLFASIYNFKKQARLLKKLDDEFWTIDKYGKKLEGEIKTTIATIQRSLKIMAVAFLCMQVAYWLQTVLSSPDELPLVTYHPVDRTKSPENKIEFVCLIWVTVYAFLIVVGFDLLFASFAIYIMFELKMIKEGILSIKIDHGKQGDESKTLKELGELVEHHSMVLGCVNDINDIYSVLLLYQLLTSVIAMCTAMIPVFTNQISDPQDYGVNTFNAATFLGQLFIYCLIGTNLVEQSESVADAIYETDWWSKTQPRFRKSVVLIIQRAQKAETIAAGGTFELNFQTFTDTVNTSSSILMLIRTLYQNK